MNDHLDLKSLSVEVSAPSNIALIKYMGKIEGTGNRPTNASLSYTLEHLRSFVRITYHSPMVEVTPSPVTTNETLVNKNQPENEKVFTDFWQPLVRNDKGQELQPIHLSTKGVEKFLSHFEFLKKQWGIKHNFVIQSANNFPSDCGLASSASSFAALTRAAAEIFQKIKPQSPAFFDVRQLSRWSRLGSGSSCRSFFSPWSLWAGEGAEKIDFPYTNLLHMVVIVEDKIKAVSSSQAHVRVTTSEMFKGRVERAQSRLQTLNHLLRSQKWAESYQIVWDEFWDMHSLFHTARPPFFYITGGSLEVLQMCQEFWEQNKNGPLVTMDAGANVHLLFKLEDRELMRRMTSLFQEKKYRIISQVQG